MSALIDTWSNDAREEDTMTDDHAWIWQEMIAGLGNPDLSLARVLDVGCNQGGFLRMLHDSHPFKSAVGVDLARAAVGMANERKGTRPIEYIATARLTDAGQDFDLAFSHEVIYLIEDLADHAAQVARVLRPGGSYHAVTCCHSDNPLWTSWRPAVAEFSNIPVPDHGVADFIEAFRQAGLEVDVSRFLANTPIPTEAPSSFFPTHLDRLAVYTRWQLRFRCTRPG